MTWTTCCCSFDLRRGTIIIGVILLITHVLEALGAIAVVVAVSQASSSSPDVYSDQQLLLSYCIGALTFSGIFLFLDIFLLYGVFRDIPVFVLFWLFWVIPLTPMSVAAWILMTFAALDKSPDRIAVVSVLLAISLVFVSGALVVFKYYRKMKELAADGADDEVSAACSSPDRRLRPVGSVGEPAAPRHGDVVSAAEFSDMVSAVVIGDTVSAVDMGDAVLADAAGPSMQYQQTPSTTLYQQQQQQKHPMSYPQGGQSLMERY